MADQEFAYDDKTDNPSHVKLEPLSCYDMKIESNCMTLDDSHDNYEEGLKDIDELIAVYQKVSVLRWFIIFLGILVCPPLGLFTVIFLIKMLLNKGSGNMRKAQQDKLMVLGLTEFSYRIMLFLALAGVVIGCMIYFERFGDHCDDVDMQVYKTDSNDELILDDNGAKIVVGCKN